MPLSQSDADYVRLRNANMRKIEAAAPGRKIKQGFCMCGVCNEVVSAIENLDRHYKHAHKRKIKVSQAAFLSGDLVCLPYECEHCDYVSLVSSVLKTHIRNNHSEAAGEITVFACPFEGCGVRMKGKRDLARHYIWTHRQRLDGSPMNFSCGCGFDMSGNKDVHNDHKCPQRPTYAVMLGFKTMADFTPPTASIAATEAAGGLVLKVGKRQHREEPLFVLKGSIAVGTPAIEGYELARPVALLPSAAYRYDLQDAVYATESVAEGTELFRAQGERIRLPAAHKKLETWAEVYDGLEALSLPHDRTVWADDDLGAVYRFRSAPCLHLVPAPSRETANVEVRVEGGELTVTAVVDIRPEPTALLLYRRPSGARGTMLADLQLENNSLSLHRASTPCPEPYALGNPSQALLNRIWNTDALVEALAARDTCLMAVPLTQSAFYASYASILAALPPVRAQKVSVLAATLQSCVHVTTRQMAMAVAVNSPRDAGRCVAQVFSGDMLSARRGIASRLAQLLADGAIKPPGALRFMCELAGLDEFYPRFGVAPLDRFVGSGTHIHKICGLRAEIASAVDHRCQRPAGRTIKKLLEPELFQKELGAAVEWATKEIAHRARGDKRLRSPSSSLKRPRSADEATPSETPGPRAPVEGTALSSPSDSA